MVVFNVKNSRKQYLFWLKKFDAIDIKNTYF